MNAGELIGISLGVLSAIAGFIVWLTNWIKSLIKSEIAAYDKQLRDERMHELIEENKRLKEWAGNSK